MIILRQRAFSEEPEQKEFGKYDVQVAKKLAPDYAKFVKNDPKALKKNERFHRAKDIFQRAMEKDVNGKLLKKELDGFKKRDRIRLEEGKKINSVGGFGLSVN